MLVYITEKQEPTYYNSMGSIQWTTLGNKKDVNDNYIRRQVVIKNVLLYLIMENQPYLPHVDFQIAINSFHDELITKLQQLNTIEIELLRKFQCSINIPQAHSELIFYLRNMIQLIEQTFKDVESYFTDLKMNFLYDYFRKVQILMVNGFNFLSQALIIQIDQNQKDRDYKATSKQKEKMIIQHKTKDARTSRNKAKDLEHCDYAINFYQNEEAKITQQLHRMQQNIMMSKGLVDKLHPSKAVKQLLQIKQRAEITLQNTEKIFEETYQLKYLQFKQHLSKLKRPQDVTKQFCDNIKITMKDKFEVGMKKSVNLLIHLKREDQLKRHVDSEIQTDDIEIVNTAKIERKNLFASKNGEKVQTLLAKERKLTQKLQLEIQIARKDVELYHAEKQRQRAMCKQLQIKYKEYHSNYDILSKMYDQKREEVINLKKIVGDNDLLISRLRLYERKYLKQYQIIDTPSQTEQLRSFKDCEAQANLEDNQYIYILKKTNEKIIQKIREKQIRLKQIERKQTNQQKQKMSRFRISHTISSQVMASLDKQNQQVLDRRSSLSSQKSISATNIVKQQQKKESKYSKPFNPSRFSIKRLSNKNIISLKSNKTSDYAVQVNLSVERNTVICTCKSIQAQFHTDHTIGQPKPQQFVRYTKKKSKPEFNSHNQTIEVMTQRRQDKSVPRRQEIFKKQIIKRQGNSPELNEGNHEAVNGYETIIAELYDEQKQRFYSFQNLNIETQQNKCAIQKRNALSKNFIHHIKKRQKMIQFEDKNKTCIGQFYKEKKSYENSETKRLICIDKLDIYAAKNKKYQKKTINSKKSEKAIRETKREKENMNVIN